MDSLTGTSFYQWVVGTTLYMMNYSFSLINATIFCTLQHKEGKHF